jgi:hypothetical protein
MDEAPKPYHDNGNGSLYTETLWVNDVVIINLDRQKFSMVISIVAWETTGRIPRTFGIDTEWAIGIGS